MPFKIERFYCGFCGRSYVDYEHAKRCEQQHKIPVRADKADYYCEVVNNDFPASVLVHFSDGTEARYYRIRK